MSDTGNPNDPASQGKPGTEGGGKTFEQIKAEYEAAVGTRGAQGKDGDAKLSALQSEVEKLRASEADRTYRKEMDSFIVPTVSGDLGIDKDLVEMWVNKQAADNPDLMTLWNDRGEKRKEFKAAIEALKPEFAKYAEDKGLVSKKAAPKSKDGKLESAVRSARSTTASPKDFSTVNLSGMSDHQFAMHSQEVFNAMKSGQLQ